MQRLTIALVLGLAILLGVVAANAAPPPSAPTPPLLSPRLVDLNRATLLELMELPGIGFQRAKAIVERRHAHPFRRPADLMRIKGFGKRMYMRLRPLVTVGPEQEVGSAPPAAPSAPAARSEAAPVGEGRALMPSSPSAADAVVAGAS